MFCSNCGEQVAEGKAFCKNCGAPIATAAIVASAASVAAAASVPAAAGETPGVGDTTVAEAVPPIAEAHKVVPPPATTFAASAPPTPPPPRATYTGSTPPVYDGYDQLQPSPGKGGETGLIIGIVLAVLIVLVAAAVAAILLLRDGDTSASVTTAVQPTSTATAPQTSTSLPASNTTAATTATTLAPPTTSTSGAAGMTTIDPVQQYLMATDAMVQILTRDDTRIPALADQINATAPNVPRGVYSELQVMLGKLDAAVPELAALPVPFGFTESNNWLGAAAGFMGKRIYSTILGIEAMYDTGSTGAATTYFSDGKIARDQYRAAFQKFQESVPID